MLFQLEKKKKLKVRQPLNKIIIPVKDKYEKQDIENAKAQIVSEINVKSIEFLDNKDSLLIKELKPNFKVLGPKYGAIINSVASRIRGFSQDEIEALENKGESTFKIDDTDVIIYLMMSKLIIKI